MKSLLKQWIGKNESLLIVIIIALSFTIAMINTAFVSTETLHETLKACVVPGIIAIGVGIVMINGGVDMSCMAIAIFSAYSSVKIVNFLGWQESVFPIFIFASFIGGGLGIVNAFLIEKFKMPIFIVTLCTGVIYKGVMLEYIGNIYITPTNMPPSTLEFSKTTFWDGMHISVLILVSLLVATALILKKTMIGRGVFALGGDPISASRVGFNIRKLNYLIYSYAGIMYAIGGVIYVCNSRMADPYDMIGTELVVIAAVVLGGVGISGGKGSVLGFFLGTLLSILIKSNLVLIGVTSDWHVLVFGLVFVGAITLQAYRENKAQNSITV